MQVPTTRNHGQKRNAFPTSLLDKNVIDNSKILFAFLKLPTESEISLPHLKMLHDGARRAVSSYQGATHAIRRLSTGYLDFLVTTFIGSIRPTLR